MEIKELTIQESANKTTKAYTKVNGNSGQRQASKQMRLKWVDEKLSKWASAKQGTRHHNGFGVAIDLWNLLSEFESDGEIENRIMKVAEQNFTDKSPAQIAALRQNIHNGFDQARREGKAFIATVTYSSKVFEKETDSANDVEERKPSANDLPNDERLAELIEDAKSRFCHASEPHKYFQIQPADERGMRMPTAISREQIKDQYGALDGVGDKAMKRILSAIYEHGFKTICQQPFMPTFTIDCAGKPSINMDTSALPPRGAAAKYHGGPFDEMLSECFDADAKTYLEDLFRWIIQSILAGKPNRRYHGVYLCGNAGVGKDTLMEILGELFGCQETNIAQAIFNESGFNLSQANFLTFISDASLPTKRGISFETFKERIKEHVSSPKMAMADKHVKAAQQWRYGPLFILLNLESNIAKQLLINPSEEGFDGKFSMLRMHEGKHMKMQPEEAEAHLRAIKDSLPDARAFFEKTPIQSHPHFRFGIQPHVDGEIMQIALDENHVTDDLAYLDALINAVNLTAQAGERSFKAENEFWILSLKAIKEIHADCLEKEFSFYKPTTQKLKPLIKKHGEDFGIEIRTQTWAGKGRTSYLFAIQITEDDVEF